MKKLYNYKARFFNAAKAQIVFIATFIIMAMITITTVAAKSYEKCDVNKDGTVDVSDAVLYLRYVSKDETLSLQYVPVDVTGDGETSIADVVYISLIIAKYDPDNPPQQYDYRTMTTETTTETTSTETTTTMTTPAIPWLHTSEKTTTTVTQYAGDSDTFFTESVIIDFPKKDDRPVYAYKDTDGTVWFFTISGNASQYQLILDSTKIEKVDRWNPTEEELAQYSEKVGNIPDFTDSFPEKTAFKVPNSSRIRAYELVDWDKIDASLIDGTVKYLMSGKSTGETKIATMDFNQNTQVDTSDVVILIRYYVINIGLSDK